MKIYHGIENFQKPGYPVVTIGTFDGVHIGHQKILEAIREKARLSGGETVLITFWPHPRLVLHPEDDTLKLLTTFEEKAALLETYGIDHLLRIPFTRDFSNMTGEDFIRNILIDTIGTQKLVIGYDHRFGKNREGSFEHLQENAGRYGFEVEEIPRQDIEDVGVSSTKIRKALEAGNVHIANEYLGRLYTVSGEVVGGDKIGRKLGYPTANIKPPYNYKLIPADGIYAVRVTVKGRQYDGVLSIGLRPTFNGKQRTIEVNIFDFSEDIYGEHLTLHFVEYIRSEKYFASTEELVQQMDKDKASALKILEG